MCEHIVVDKLPFTPVEEALAEWLASQGRDPFAELSVPRAGMKLAQWVGRGVRTETDRAVITVCDTRLAMLARAAAVCAGALVMLWVIGPFELMSKHRPRWFSYSHHGIEHRTAEPLASTEHFATELLNAAGTVLRRRCMPMPMPIMF
ncbi:helicase C-terminal domain-containing protein [Polaromonas hydrogenivorans]|uniref:Helicase C-terminal domain-containing protein n=1 Tax=Polaromonas hydrogenivorans TaxID=335476 RepID=A0AAU7LZX7_9BURK